jgi:hypothetical protein
MRFRITTAAFLAVALLGPGAALVQSGAGGASLLSVCPKKSVSLEEWTAAAAVDVTDLRVDNGIASGESAVYRVHLEQPLVKPDSLVFAGELVGACATTTVAVDTGFGVLQKPKLCADDQDCATGDTCQDTRPTFQDTSDNAALILSIFERVGPGIQSALEPLVPACANSSCQLCIKKLTRPNFANLIPQQPGRCAANLDEPCFGASDCGTPGDTCGASQTSVTMTGVNGRVIRATTTP